MAHKQIAAQMIQTNYAIIASATGGGGSGSSSGGSSGSGSSSRGRGSSSGGNQNAGKMQTLYLVTDRTGDVAYFYNKVEAQMERNDRMDQFATIKEVSINSNSIQNGRIGNTRVVAKGGIEDFTGPALLDGTTTAPERILSPVQTELFEKLVASLETMARIRVPSMDAFDGGITSGGTPINVGDIIVNVDKMDTDADYEELAERVFETIMSR